jgi:hypothetical protein
VLYLALGALALWLILRAAARAPRLKRREWRFITSSAAIVALAGAAYAGLRGAWEPALILLAFGGWLALSTRRAAPAAHPPRQDGRMSLAEARAILGVGPEARPDEVQAAYARLMRAVHPDKGGTHGLASQLNAARDRLLRG